VLDLERSFGFLVNDVARLFGRRFSHNGRRLGLTRAQCRTLGYLARNEGVNQAGLADLLEIRPMTLVRQIDRMEEAGWIERHPDPADRRARRLYLTVKAKPLLEQIWHLAELTRAETLAGISLKDREAFIGVLERIHGNLCALEGQPLPASESVVTPLAPRNTSDTGNPRTARKTRAQ